VGKIEGGEKGITYARKKVFVWGGREGGGNLGVGRGRDGRFWVGFREGDLEVGDDVGVSGEGSELCQLKFPSNKRKHFYGGTGRVHRCWNFRRGRMTCF